MDFAPLFNALPPIPLHAIAAMSAFVLGVVQLAAPKGTLPHRTLGWIWVGLMAFVTLSSFWIHQIRLVGPWSPIHLLSIFTLVIAAARRLAGASASGAGAPLDHDRYLYRRLDYRRLVYGRSRADHARRFIRPVTASKYL